MAPDQSLTQWIQEQYWVLGLDSAGGFIGKKPFKNRLIRRHVDSESAKGRGSKILKRQEREIRELVNA